MEILLDSDALVALAKADDKNHKKARLIAEKLKEENLYISPLTIPEAATVLSHKVSQEAACLFLKKARKRKHVYLPLGEEVEKKADKIFFKEKKKGISWPDCLNIAFIKKYSLDAVFSFDKVYKRHQIPLVEDLL